MLVRKTPFHPFKKRLFFYQDRTDITAAETTAVVPLDVDVAEVKAIGTVGIVFAQR